MRRALQWLAVQIREYSNARSVVAESTACRTLPVPPFFRPLTSRDAFHISRHIFHRAPPSHKGIVLFENGCLSWKNVGETKKEKNAACERPCPLPPSSPPLYPALFLARSLRSLAPRCLQFFFVVRTEGSGHPIFMDFTFPRLSNRF